MLIFLIVIISLSLLILSHEAGHFLVAKLFKLKINEFGFGFPPRIFAKRKHETEYSLNWLPFGGFVKIAGENEAMPFDESGEAAGRKEISKSEKKRLFSFQPAWKRSLIILAGVAVNFLIGWILISAVLMVGTPQTLVITGIQPNSPAATVGLMDGDIIHGFTKSSDFIRFVDAHRGGQITVTIDRGGKELTFTATPRVKMRAREGALGVFLAEGGAAKEGIIAALYNGLKASLAISWAVLATFYLLVKNLFIHGSLLAGVVGPVGIFSVAAEAGKIGFVYLVQLIGLISLNLAVINLIPFPALDGGRFLFILIEKIKGSPIPRKAEAWLNGAGFAFLIFLIFLITVRDVRMWL